MEQLVPSPVPCCNSSGFVILRSLVRFSSCCLGVKCWYVEYPWITPRSALPRNEKQALQCLHALEKRLAKDANLAQDFSDQIQAMVDSEVVRVLSDEEIRNWKGDYYYLPMVGVKEPKKDRIRVCYDASRKVGGYPSMNMCLMKGPDRFINDMQSVVLSFRNGRVGCAADITKFHHQVRLIEKDVHMQRFLWDGKTYAVTRNNFGVRAANSIATIALHASADEFASVYPIESREVKEQTYVDDELTAARDIHEARIKTSRWDEICEHAGCLIKDGSTVVTKHLMWKWVQVVTR